jgi:branched-chain amino acid transport system ATP-binding protein
MSTWAERTPVLQVKNVFSGYGAMEILRNISLSVSTGDIISIVGSNGAGKSTLLRTITGLLPARKGEIIFKKQNITTTPPHKIFNMGLVHVPEGRGLFSPLTVYENLILGCYPNHGSLGEDGLRARLDKVFNLFPKLAERNKQTAGSLSGGEQQMLAIGRALMAEPVLMLLDEPSQGLAPILVGQIGKVLQELNKAGASIMLVEQSMVFALPIAHYAYVLELGSVAMEGKSEELLKDEKVRQIYLGEASK